MHCTSLQIPFILSIVTQNKINHSIPPEMLILAPKTPLAKTQTEPQPRRTERLRLSLEHPLAHLGIPEHHAAAHVVQDPAELGQLPQRVWRDCRSV